MGGGYGEEILQDNRARRYVMVVNIVANSRIRIEGGEGTWGGGRRAQE